MEIDPLMLPVDQVSKTKRVPEPCVAAASEWTDPDCQLNVRGVV
jgi:hypothetical protein